MSEGFDRDELLEVPRIAEYLRVSDVTVYRWCREGRLPCLKLGNSWRVRRSALEGFLERGERSATLVGQLRPFYRVPDNVLAIAQTPELLFRLDAAFFRIGEARGARLVKFHGSRTLASIEELRARMKGEGLDVERLEGEGRFRFVENYGRPEDDRVRRVLRGVYDREVREGRGLWASFDWTKDVDFERALGRQGELTRFVADRHLVVQTTVLERDADEWPPSLGRRAQLAHSATLWLSAAGLASTRVTPVTEG